MKKRRTIHFFSLKFLAKELSVSEEFLLDVLNKRRGMYKFRPNAKVGKKERNLFTAKKPLENIHKGINKVLDTLDLPEAFQGSIKGKSVKTNATIHLGAQEILKIDIKDFFPSITPEKVKKAFRKLGLSEKCAQVLTLLVTVQVPTPHLPQGFSTSPKVAALTLSNFERHLHRLSKTYGWRYSFWVDDITISSQKPLANLKNLLIKILREDGFVINPKKLKLMTRNGRMVINGVVINKFPNVPKHKRNEIKNELFYLKKYGIANHLTKKKVPLTAENIKKLRNTLQGKISYVKAINLALAKKYQKDFDSISWIISKPTVNIPPK